jgi:hypothetical protein
MLNAGKKAEELLNYIEKLKTNNMAQTVSEWIFQEEKKAFDLLDLGEISHATYRLKIINIEKQAKAIEKDQIRMAFTDGKWSNTFANATSEQYYNETYNK